MGSLAGGSQFHSESGSVKVFFRPVLCVVPPYSSAVQPAMGRLSTLSCTPASLMSVTNLGTAPSDNADGYSVNAVPLDSNLAGTPSTKPSADVASATVLLPGLSSSLSVDRYLLGPAQMSGSSIGKADAAYEEFEKGWVVNITMTKSGAALWNKVAKADFHKELAIVVGGIVVSAPLIQPGQVVFSSFGPYATVAGNGIGRAEARNIARAMTER
jgi:hypothetical protein